MQIEGECSLRRCKIDILFVGMRRFTLGKIIEPLREAGIDAHIFLDDKDQSLELCQYIFADIGSDLDTAHHLIERLKAANPTAKLTLICQSTSLSFIIPLIRLGAWDVMPEPVSEYSIVEKIIASQEMNSGSDIDSFTKKSSNTMMLGECDGMLKLKQDIQKAAPTDARILITGENGVGKELVAQAIHDGSKRAQQPFVKVNCAAIPAELIESELFGYEPGAFTGALKQKKGLIEHAEGGTLFFDEIGDMAIETQVKVLRVLQENEFVRVGGKDAVPFDVRIIAATNKNLREEIEKGTFRKDLFFRLNVIPLQVLPLRERGDDILLLFKHFMAMKGGNDKKLTDDAIVLLRNYGWPGNVRELFNAAERIAVMIGETEIEAENLLAILPDLAKTYQPTARSSGILQKPKRQLSLRESIEVFERDLLMQAYQEYNGNISEIARRLLTDRANLHRKLKKYAIH